MEYFDKDFSSEKKQEKMKKNPFRHIVGWILLIIGLVIISWTLVSSYNIFNAGIEPPEIFKIETEEISTSTKQASQLSYLEIQQELEKMIGDQLGEVLPLDFLPKTFNLIAWSILAFILIFGGAQISGLGIKLIKK